MALPDEWKEKFLARVETWESDANERKQQQIDRLKAELAALKARLDRLNTAFVEGGLELAEFKELKNPLVEQKVNFETKLTALEQGTVNRLEFLKSWIFEANQAEKWAFEENWLEMKSFLKKAGSNRQLRAQTLTATFKKPWIYLAETRVAVRSTPDISEQNSKWWSRGDSNP